MIFPSAECTIVCHGILKYCLRDMLGSKQWKTLFFLLDTLNSALAESHQLAEFGPLREQLNTALAILERDFPISVQVHKQGYDNICMQYPNITHILVMLEV